MVTALEEAESRRDIAAVLRDLIRRDGGQIFDLPDVLTLDGLKGVQTQAQIMLDNERTRWQRASASERSDYAWKYGLMRNDVVANVLDDPASKEFYTNFCNEATVEMMSVLLHVMALGVESDGDGGAHAEEDKEEANIRLSTAGAFKETRDKARVVVAVLRACGIDRAGILHRGVVTLTPAIAAEVRKVCYDYRQAGVTGRGRVWLPPPPKPVAGDDGGEERMESLVRLRKYIGEHALQRLCGIGLVGAAGTVGAVVGDGIDGVSLELNQRQQQQFVTLFSIQHFSSVSSHTELLFPMTQCPGTADVSRSAVLHQAAELHGRRRPYIRHLLTVWLQAVSFIPGTRGGGVAAPTGIPTRYLPEELRSLVARIRNHEEEALPPSEKVA